MKLTVSRLREKIKRPGLGQNVLLSLIQSATGTLAFFFAIRLLIRESGPEAFGLWSLITGILAFSRIPDIFGGSRLSRLVAMQGADCHEKILSVNTVTLLLLGYYAIVALAGSMLFPKLVTSMVDPTLSDTAAALVPFGLASIFTVVLMIAQLSALDGTMRADLRAKTMMAGSTIHLASSLVLIPRYGIFGFASAQIIQQSACLVGARLLLMKQLNGMTFIPLSFSYRAMKEAVSFGTKMQVTSIPQMIYEPAARIYIHQLAGLQVLAAYDLAYKLCSYTRMTLLAAAMPLVPEFAQLGSAGSTRLVSLYQRATRYSITLSAVAFGGLCLALPLISVFLFDAISGPFLVATASLSIAWSIAGIGSVPSIYNQARGLMRWNIAGEWSIAALTFLVVPSLASVLGPKLIFASIAIALTVGLTVSLLGNHYSIQSDFPRATLTRKTLFPLAPQLIIQISVMTFGLWVTT